MDFQNEVYRIKSLDRYGTARCDHFSLLSIEDIWLQGVIG